MVESDHGESAEDVMTTVKTEAVDADAKKNDIVVKRQREDSSGDEKFELPSKRPRSEIKEELPGEPERDSEEPVHKANGSAAIKEETMEVDGQDGTRENSKAALSNSGEKTDEDDSSVLDEKEDESNAQNDATVNKVNVENKDNGESDIQQPEDSEKKDASSGDKDDAEDDDEADGEKADSSLEEKASDDKSGKPSVSKSRTKDPEVVDGLEMSVECASDKEASSSDGEKDDEKTTKTRPKTIIVKAKPNDSELEVSGSGSEKSDEENDEKVEKAAKKSKASPKNDKGSPERKRGRKKTFSKPMSSESEEKSSDDASDDEDYSPRTKKKMKKATPAKKPAAKTPASGKRRGRAPKKPAKKSEDEHSDEDEAAEEEEDVNLAQRSQKGKDKAQKKNSESEDEEKSEEEHSDAGRKTTKRSKARPEDDKRIQTLKKYMAMAGITVPSYEKFWAGCKTNTARLARMKERLAEHGVTGRPTIEKCKKAKARMEMRKDVESLDQSAVMEEVTEGRVTRARGGANKKPPTSKGESSPRREARKRVMSVVDSDSE